MPENDRAINAGLSATKPEVVALRAASVRRGFLTPFDFIRSLLRRQKDKDLRLKIREPRRAGSPSSS
jgi:hypothetical protein